MTGKLKAKGPTTRDRADALRLQRAGTKGDTILAHINPQEAGLLDWLADRKIDATRNPKTGLLSFGENDSDDDGGISGGSGTDSFGGGYSGGGDIGGGGGDGGYSPWGGSLSMTPSIANMSLDQLSAIDKAIADDIDTNYGGMYGTGFTARTDGWASPNTFGRLAQEMWNGPAYNAPGRFGMPNGIGPGIFGTAIAQMVGGPMSAMMGLGAAMGRAGGAYDDKAANATNGQDRRADALGSPVAGSGGSGGLLGDGTATSAAASTTAPGTTPVVTPGSVMDTSGRGGSTTLTGLPAPVQNLLADYIWRGRQGSGFGW